MNVKLSSVKRSIALLSIFGCLIWDFINHNKEKGRILIRNLYENSSVFEMSFLMNRKLLFLLLILFVSSTMSYAQSHEIKFKLHTTTHTPEGETVVLYNNWNSGTMHPMKKVGDNAWETTLNLFIGNRFDYYFCRNYMHIGAEEIEFNSTNGNRTLSITADLTTITDTVNEWKWWPTDGIVPEIDYSLHASERPEIISSSDFQCGIELPDFWWPQFSPTVVSTLDKIIPNSNSTWVQYAPVPEITQFYPSPIIDMYGNNGTPDDALVNIITSAHNRGLKFFLRPFQWTLFVTDESPNNHSDEWWIDYSDQWLPIITHYAILSEEHGVEMIDLSIWNAGGETHKPILDSLLCNMVDTLRSIYSGKLSMELNPWGAELEVYSKVDYLSFKLWDTWPITLSDSKDPTVSEMLNSLRNGLDELFKPWCDNYNKKLILSEIAASSLDGSVNGSESTWDNEYWDQINENTFVDLQEQADVHEAMLQAITEREWIAGAYSFGYNYWNSVDKTPSIRNKPAEQVLAKWWRWITPDKRHLTISSEDGGTTQPFNASYILNKDTTVTLDAIADPDYIFSEWIGDVTSDQASMNPLSITMNTDKKVIATFIPLTTSIEDIPVLTSNSFLSQNYPNPFNSNTTIQFELSTRCSVSLYITNLNGEVVFELLNSFKPEGLHSIDWNANNLSSGYYIYTIIAQPVNGGKPISQTKKMIYLQFQ